eukprot:scaffold45913_cov38-Prasinocladus_malaysianus.AAC.1
MADDDDDDGVSVADGDGNEDGGWIEHSVTYIATNIDMVFLRIITTTTQISLLSLIIADDGDNDGVSDSDGDGNDDGGWIGHSVTYISLNIDMLFVSVKMGVCQQCTHSRSASAVSNAARLATLPSSSEASEHR